MFRRSVPAVSKEEAILSENIDRLASIELKHNLAELNTGKALQKMTAAAAAKHNKRVQGALLADYKLKLNIETALLQAKTTLSEAIGVNTIMSAYKTAAAAVGSVSNVDVESFDNAAMSLEEARDKLGDISIGLVSDASIDPTDEINAILGLDTTEDHTPVEVMPSVPTAPIPKNALRATAAKVSGIVSPKGKAY